MEGRQTTVTFTGLSPRALAAKPFTPLKKKSSLMSLWSNDSRDVKLKNLKQELEMDEHKIPLATLFSRLKTDPIMVCGRVISPNESNMDLNFVFTNI